MNFSGLLKIASFTFLQAACSTLMALAVGIPAAFFCGRRKFFGRRFLLSLSVIPFCIPSLIIALGYVTFLGNNGGLNQFLMFIFGLKEPPVRILYSFFGLIVTHGFYNFPLIMKNVSEAWERLPVEQSESARLLGAGEGRIFRTITIHQLMPSILSSSLLVFVYCFLSFILVLLFGGVGNSTLEVEIYNAKTTLNFGKAISLAIIETLILCVITIFYSIIEQRKSVSKGIISDGQNQRKKISGILEISSFVLIIFLIIVFFVAPLIGIVFNGFSSSKVGEIITLNTFKNVLKMRNFLPSLKNTLITAFSTGFFGMFLGFSYSVFLRFMERKNRKTANIILKILPMIPMTISSVVIGFIITMIVRTGNVFWLIFAQTALNWPLAFKVIYPQLSKISDVTLDEAILISKNKLDIIFRVIIPVTLPSMISAFGFCFAVSAGDTTLPLVLSIPKFSTLSLFTYGFANAYRFNEACASGLLLGFICASVFVLSSLVGKVKKRDL